MQGSRQAGPDRVFDAHLHIIDPRFPLQENNGYLPPTFTVGDYERRVADLEFSVALWFPAHSRVSIRTTSPQL